MFTKSLLNLHLVLAQQADYCLHFISSRTL